MLKFATKFAPAYDAFEAAAQAGFCYAEFFLSPAILDEWQDVVSLSQSFGMEYVAHFPNRQNLAPQTIRNLVRLVEELEIKTVVIHSPQWRQFAGNLADLELTAVLAVENHYQSVSDLDAWIEESPAITLDVEHLWKFTLKDARFGELLELVKRVVLQAGRKLRHVHMPGYVPGYEEHRPIYCSRELAFEVLDILLANDYQGQIVSELDMRYQNAHELRMDRLLFETWRDQSRVNPSPSRIPC